MIPFIDIHPSSPEYIKYILDQKGAKGEIDQINWSAFPYKPEVKFGMAYNENFLFLVFYIQEQYIRALEVEPNGKVWEDSCSEFFLSFDNTGYYNIETNCIGTQLVGFGKNRHNRTHLPNDAIRSIIAHSSLDSHPIEPQTGHFDYQLSLIIPATSFRFHPDLKFKPGMQINGNFYKCGDKTDQPHFVSWNPISTNEPDFHQPDFFGILKLK